MFRFSNSDHLFFYIPVCPGFLDSLIACLFIWFPFSPIFSLSPLTYHYHYYYRNHRRRHLWLFSCAADKLCLSIGILDRALFLLIFFLLSIFVSLITKKKTHNSVDVTMSTFSIGTFKRTFPMPA